MICLFPDPRLVHMQVAMQIGMARPFSTTIFTRSMWNLMQHTMTAGEYAAAITHDPEGRTLFMGSKVAISPEEGFKALTL